MKRILLSIGLILGASLSGIANNLKIENVAFDQAAGTMSFDISWDNSWNINEDYHDAVWIFAKYKASNSNQWKPIVFDDGNGNAASFSGTGLEFTAKGVGFIIKSAVIAANQKDITTTNVTVSGLSVEGVNPSIKVFGTEMVYVPEGNFEAGDAASTYVFRSLESFDPILIEASTIKVYGSSVDSSVYVLNITEGFPAGYRSFYSMKYEITQGQIVDFANTLTASQQPIFYRNPDDSFKYPLSNNNSVLNRNGIAVMEDNRANGSSSVFGMDLNNNGIFNELEDGATIACNYMNEKITLAYLDWSGLRPMTELEYEKACRGTDRSIPLESAAGIPISVPILNETITNAGTPAEFVPSLNLNYSTDLGPLRVGFASTDNSNRISSTNSFYGIANLSDNVTEMVVELTAASEVKYDIHGDGVLFSAVANFNEYLSNEPAWETGAAKRYYEKGGLHGSSSFDSLFTSVSSRRFSSWLVSPEYVGGRGVLSFE